jgi:hypothetical protein
MLLEPKEIERDTITEEQYDEMLDEQGPVNVCGMQFDPSRILKELDPIAYNCGLSDMQDTITVYECPVCGDEHEDYDDAKFCCQEEEEEDEEE